jgi:hypothetical protein
MKPSLTDLSGPAYASDVVFFVFVMVGIIVGVILLHIDD